MPDSVYAYMVYLTAKFRSIDSTRYIHGIRSQLDTHAWLSTHLLEFACVFSPVWLFPFFISLGICRESWLDFLFRLLILLLFVCFPVQLGLASQSPE